MTGTTNMEFSNKCTKCGTIIHEKVASYSFHAFGEELCFSCQSLVKFELKVQRSKKLFTDSTGGVDAPGVGPVLPSR